MAKSVRKGTRPIVRQSKKGKLTGNASGDDNNVGAGQGVLQAIILGQVAREFLPTMLENKAARLERGSTADVTYSDGGDVREIGSNTRSVDNIVEGKLVNKRAGLQEERQRLYRTTMRLDSIGTSVRGTEEMIIPVQFHQRHREQLFSRDMGLATRAIFIESRRGMLTGFDHDG